MDYNPIAWSTTQTIRASGARITLMEPGDASYDPATSTNSADPGKYEGHAVRSEYSTREIDGTNIKSGDAKFLLAVHDINDKPMPRPVEGDTLTFGGETLRVVKSTPVSPAGVAVMWKTQARR
jgi:hypothetical protein